MEATGKHLEEFGSLAALLPRAGSAASGTRAAPLPPGTKLRPSGGACGGNLPFRHGHLQAVRAGITPSPAGSEMLPAPTEAEAEGLPALCLSGLADLLNAAATDAADALRGAGYLTVSQFAGQVEDLARTIEHLQLLSAGAVDRTRTEAIAAADAARSSRSRSWVTGWDNGVESLDETDANWPAATTPAACPDTNGSAEEGSTTDGSPTDGARGGRRVVTSPADDGCRNTAEFLRLRLRVPLREARRRLALANQTLPGTSLTGEPVPPARPHLATALTPAPGAAGPSPDPAFGPGPADPAANAANATSTDTGADPGTCRARVSAPVVSSYAGTIIASALDRLQRLTTPETLAVIEKDLTTAAINADPDFVARLAQRWAEGIDADGAEPSEEALRHIQGAFLRKPRHGLHHLEIFATTEQYEHLLTAMNAATNPRTTTSLAAQTQGTRAPGLRMARARMETAPARAPSGTTPPRTRTRIWNGAPGPNNNSTA